MVHATVLSDHKYESQRNQAIAIEMNLSVYKYNYYGYCVQIYKATEYSNMYLNFLSLQATYNAGKHKCSYWYLSTCTSPEDLAEFLSKLLHGGILISESLDPVPPNY